jgi:hypothetical protein
MVGNIPKFTCFAQKSKNRIEAGVSLEALGCILHDSVAVWLRLNNNESESSEINLHQFPFVVVCRSVKVVALHFIGASYFYVKMSAPTPSINVLGGMATFNMGHGFVEALVRGMRSSFLSDSDYHHLTQCENLEVNFTGYCIYFSSIFLMIVFIGCS